MAAPTYITDEELKETLRLQGTEFADEDVTRAVRAASRAIDEMAGRTYYPSPTAAPDDEDYEAEVRYFTATSWRRVDIDDLLHVDEVATTTNRISYLTWPTTDYLPEPLNAAAKGKPYELLHAFPNRRRFPVDVPAGVRVTGRFGWETAPDQVIELTGILATKFFKRAREAPFGIVTIGVEVATAIRIARSDPDTAMLVEGLTRRAVLA